MQITKNLAIDDFVLWVLIMISLACLGVYGLILYAGGEEDRALADLDKMGCGELKQFITDKGWKEYGARNPVIEDQARHTYTWTCEK